MSHNCYIDRRQLLQVMGLTGMTAIASTLPTNIARALEIPANNQTGTIQDVEHINAPSVHVPPGFDFTTPITEELQPIPQFLDDTQRDVAGPGPTSRYGLALANMTLGLVAKDPYYITMTKALFAADAELAKDGREKEAARLAVRYTDMILSGEYPTSTDTSVKAERVQLRKYPRLPGEFSHIVLGTTAINVKKKARIKIQADRVIRDWIQSEHVKSAPWDYSPKYLVRSHEGEKAEELVKLTDATVIPVWGTKAKKIGDDWYGPDAEGIYRFPFSVDKVENFPSTILIDDRTAIVNDTHGISAIAWDSTDADLAIGCGDHPGKIEAAYYLAERGVNVYVPTDRFLSMLIGTHTKALVIGSAPVKEGAEGAVLGDQPISIDVNEPIVVSNAKAHYPLQYYDTPYRYFQALQDYIRRPLKITAVEVKEYGHATNVVDVARANGVRVLGIRVKTKEEHDAVAAWLRGDKRRRAVLFHTVVYPDGYKLFFEFPQQTTFGDVYLRLE